MAVVGPQAVWSKKLPGGGVGFLSEGKRCSRSASGYRLQERGVRTRTSVVLWKARKSTIIAQQDEGNLNSKVFQSMSDATERRKEDAALGSFDPVDIAKAVSDAELLERSSRKSRAVQPPRFATLRAFGEAGGDGVVTGEFEGTSVFELIAANIEASQQVKNWEVLSGRLAMLALSIALGVELFTGNSVFNGVDTQKLEAVVALCVVATLSAAGFAYAWRAKADVVTLMSKNYKNMLESALDNLIDGLFFDEA